MKTYIFVRNKNYRPSTYYRIIQYLDDNLLGSVEIIEYELNGYYNSKSQSKINHLIKGIFFSLIPGYARRILSLNKILKQDKPYNIFIQRECFPKIIGPLGKYLLRKTLQKSNEIYWDFDDNIFDSKEITDFEKKLLINYSENILVGNEYLQKLDILKGNKNTKVINTTDKMMEQINVSEINCLRQDSFNEEISLIWVGTKNNLFHLENIIPELDKSALLLDKKVVQLKIVCDGQLNLSTKKLKIINIKWERDIALKEMMKSHIGLMPLIENEFTKGKCAFKAVQAIGAGLPVIVSDVGMNNEVVSNKNGILIKDVSEWSSAVLNLSKSYYDWELNSINSRKLWEKNYNSEKIQNSLLEIVKN